VRDRSAFVDEDRPLEADLRALIAGLRAGEPSLIGEAAAC
jgi:hypothetical protein